MGRRGGSQLLAGPSPSSQHQKVRRRVMRMVRRLSIPYSLKLSKNRPKNVLRSIEPSIICRVVGSTARLKVPRSATELSSLGGRSGWLKTLLNCPPSRRLNLSLIRKVLSSPRLTPHAPGPLSRLRLATFAFSNTSAPSGGAPNAFGSKNRSPDRTFGLPVTTGRNDVPPKPPTASIEPLPILPG